MQAPTYRYLSLHPTYAPNGDMIVAELPLQDVKWNRTLSAAGSLSARINVRDPKATLDNILAGYHHLAVERNGSIVWNGPLWTVQTMLRDQDPFLTLGARDWFSWFQEQGDTTRCLETDSPVEWTTIDQIAVAGQCIEMAQADDGLAPNMDVGVTVSPDNEDSGVVRDDLDYAAEERVAFGAIIASMAEKADGFDFVVDAEWDPDVLPSARLKKTFRTYSPRKTGLALAGLSNGMLITQAAGTWDATRMGTHVVAVGSDGSDSAIDVSTGFWRRDLVRKYETDDAAVLGQQALAAAGRYGHPVVLPSVSVVNNGTTDLLNSFALGDTMHVDLDMGYYVIHEDMRIASYDVDVQQGQETITFNLNPLVD